MEFLGYHNVNGKWFALLLQEQSSLYMYHVMYEPVKNGNIYILM